MSFNLSSTRYWHIPYNGSWCEVYKVVDKRTGTILWRKYYNVIYESNTTGSEYNSIVFNANGGIGSMLAINVDAGESATIPEFGFTRLGYDVHVPQFNTMPNRTGQSYSVGDAITPTQNITLYAQWDAKNYTISFNSNGGLGSMNSITAAYNSTVQLPECTFTKAGYEFDAWKCYINTSEEYFADGGQMTMPNQSIELSAQWQAIA